MTDDIVSCSIHPGIGIARVGNSQTGSFLGPEVPRVASSPDFYKDHEGAIKRQIARFRIYGLNARGQVVKELTATDGEITWFVHLANKKAAWYEFQLALDSPEARATLPGSKRRNANRSGSQRTDLIIDPGERQISGVEVQGQNHHFDSGSFLGNPVYLGELRTDASGRLLVLGGRGHSDTPLANNPAKAFANNDDWHDDVSDGPVRASVTVDGRVLWANPAWVIIAPPAYAPDNEALVTLYDVAYQAHLDAGRGQADRPVSFMRDIFPILQRLTRLQWVNQGFLEEFGWGGQNNLMDSQTLTHLSSNGSESAQDRHSVFNHFRDPAAGNIEENKWPPIYGDSFDQPPAYPEQFLTVTRDQFRCLREWALGNFRADGTPQASVPAAIDALPLQAQPSTLDEAALAACSGGPFHPGAEATWPMRRSSMYSGLCRLRHPQAEDPPEPDFGDVLTPSRALGGDGPLHRSGPGDITRWMAVPWQTDTSSCGSAYRGAGTVTDGTGRKLPDLPTFWPAAVPNRVLTHAAYSKVIDEDLPIDARRKKFQQRVPWSRHLPQEYQPHINAFVTQWSRVGIIRERPGSVDGNLPPRMLVETESTFPTPPQVASALAAGSEPDEIEQKQFSDLPSMPLLDDWRSHK